eukprot:359814-Chlamydomonas_euryale.AAC.5
MSPHSGRHGAHTLFKAHTLIPFQGVTAGHTTAQLHANVRMPYLQAYQFVQALLKDVGEVEQPQRMSGGSCMCARGSTARMPHAYTRVPKRLQQCQLHRVRPHNASCTASTHTMNTPLHT